MASKNTLSTLSIGFVGSNSHLMGTIEETIGGFQHLAQAGNSTLAPALGGVGAAGKHTALGLGQLEHLVEVLGLRVLATSTQVSNLAQAMRKGSKGQKTFTRDTRATTKALSEQERTADTLGLTLGNLSRQAKTRSSRATRLQVIDGDGEISKLVRIRSEIREIAQERQRQQMAERARTGIPADIAALEAKRSGAGGSRQIEIQEMISKLKSEQLQLGMQLRAMEDGSDSAASQIVYKQKEMNALIAQRQRMQSRHVKDYKTLLNMKQRDNLLARQKPPSLAQHIVEWKSITGELNSSNTKIQRLNGLMAKVTGDEQRILRLEKERTAEITKRDALQRKHGDKTNEIERLKKLKDDAVSELRGSVDAQKARGVMTADGLSPAAVNHRVSQQYTAELKKHEEILAKNVALGNLTVKQAQKQLATFKRINTQQMTGMIKNQRQIAAGGGRMAYAMQNFGFMIEDGASQLGTRGLAGAVGAMSNNLTAMVSVLARNPMTLIFTSVGVAVTQLLLQTGALEKAFAALGFAAKKNDKDMKSLTRTMEALSSAQRVAYQQTKKLAELRSGGSSQELRGQIKEEEQAHKEALAKMAIAEEKLQAKKDEAREKELQAEIDATGERAQLTGGLIDQMTSRGIGEKRMIQDRHRAAQKEMAELQARKAARAAGASEELQAAIAARQEVENAELRADTARSMRHRRLTQERLAAEGEIISLRRKGQVAIQEALRGELSGADLLNAKVSEQGRLLGQIATARRELNARGVTAGTAESRIAAEEKLLETTAAAVELEKEIRQIRATGLDAAQSAMDSLAAARDRNLSATEKAEAKRTSEQEKYYASLKKAYDLRQITLKQMRESRDALRRIHAEERKHEKLKEKKKKLEDQFRERSKSATVQSGVEAGSAEAMGLINQAKLDSFNATMNEPLIAEMQAVNTALSEVNTSIKAIPTLNLKKKQ